LYLPTDDAWAHFTAGKVSINQSMDALLGPNLIAEILDAGYNFDFIDDEAIAKVGIGHRVLVLPKVERMPEATRARIEEFKRRGGIVAHEGELQSVHARLAPDVATAPEIGVVHRKLDYADVYFLVNTSNKPVDAEAKFRVNWKYAEWWDPMTGDAKPTRANKGRIQFAPYESRVLAFSNRATLESPLDFFPSGEPPDVSRGWKVTFTGKTPVEMDTLRSWPADYTGIATYEKAVTIKEKGRGMFLSFGEGTPVTPEKRTNGMRAWFEGPVREAAVVYLNGQRAGSVWSAPYQVDISKQLRSGENRFRIVVANLAFNKLAQGPLPDYKLLNALYGVRFQAQDLENLKPLDSGLPGSIRLISR